ncbi:MAG: ABC transporter ATP-binding protein, partial [Acidimicrobiia bacterium]
MNGLDALVQVDRGSFRLDLALTVAPGTTVALLGPNGAGKSTAVMALSGLLAITDGRIAIAGTVVDDPVAGVFVPPERRRVGIVFQDYLLFPHLSALENVAFGQRSRGMARDEARVRATSWLDRLGLAGSAQRRPGELSGGQAQRVALARALATEPDLLLLDEPLSALDVTTRVELRRVLMEHLDAFPGPRVLITHDPTEAFLLADEIHIIEGGSSTQSGTAEDIRLRPRTRYAADLAGANLVSGIAEDGVIAVDGQPLHIADHAITGSVLATIRPAAITINRLRPEGSPRNA